jgi:DNA-binding MurR/RpiR family transcriptional regulator
MVESSVSLSRQERKVEAYAIRDPLRFATTSAADVAREAGVSEATVIRAAQKLGFKGVKEMKAAYAARVERGVGLEGVMESRLARLRSVGASGPSRTLGSVLASAADLLLSLSETLDPAAFARAAEGIGGAPRTVVYGLGTGLQIAGYFALELERGGIDAAVVSGSGHTNADAVYQLRPDDAVMVLAPRVVFDDVAAFIAGAAEVVGEVVVVSQDEIPRPPAGAVIELRLPSTAGEVATESVAAWGVCDALVAEVVRARPERALEARTRLQRLRETYSARSARPHRI